MNIIIISLIYWENILINFKSLISQFYDAEPDGPINYWVGATKDKSTGNWMWTTSESIGTGPPYFAYDEGSHRGENCATVSKEKYWKLTDEPCDAKRYFKIVLFTI